MILKNPWHHKKRILDFHGDHDLDESSDAYADMIGVFLHGRHLSSLQVSV
jgi:hypothetical protein